jgi:SCP-2 sterol transfer family
LRGVRYLSPDWIDAAGRALAADDRLAAALAGVTLTVEQEVSGGPDGPVTWHLAIADGKVVLGAGPSAQADLRLSTDYPTAAGVAAGELGAQRAFVEGRLQVGGDLSLLITHQRALAAVHDALAPVRAATSY